MSQNAGKSGSTRKLSSDPARPAPQPKIEEYYDEVEDDYEEYEDEPVYDEGAGVSYRPVAPARQSRYAPPPPPRGVGRNAPPPRGAGGRGYRNYGYSSVGPPPRRDTYSYFMGGVIGALVVGLIALAYLLGTARGSAPSSSSNTSNTPGNGNLNSQPIQQPVTTDAPRISLADFRTLYDDPAKRPFIVDVRTSDLYNAAHMTGAVNIPQSEVDARIAEFPKDKLIVAYCQ